MMQESGAAATAPISSRQMNIHIGATITDPFCNLNDSPDKEVKTIKPQKTRKLQESRKILNLRSSTRSEFSIKQPGK